MKLKKGKFFPYGIHVDDRKQLTKHLPIEVMPTPEKVFICLSQHIGAPAIATVNVGDKVKKGQIVGEASGAISANVFASVSGEVIAVEDYVNGLGQKQKYVVIDNDRENQEVLFENIGDFEKTSLIERIRQAGIVGLGGAGFPTAVKLTPKNQLDTLIINGAECEPYLTCDYRLMLEKAEDIHKGIQYTAKALGLTKIIIGIEANKPDAIELFSQYKDLEVIILKKQYPMGSEKHLIYCTTGRKVPLGKMPFDVGVCVQNVKTMIAVKEAIEDNKPLTEIVMTVSGQGVDNPKNIKVAIGTPFKDIASFCGVKLDEIVKIIAGGPMMGKALSGFNQWTRKTDSGFLLLTKKETDSAQPTNCINCAKCASNCPMRLMPMYIEAFALSGHFDKAERYGAMNCIECGSCAYNCPAKRPLVQSISYAKAKIKESKQNGK